ncbi:MAG: HEPN domain-containing protein [Actinomycetota bacterium]|nr:HEPN domain-containing protein [Actinomycetota bacterium]
MDAPLDGEEFHRWRRQADSASQTADLARAGGRAEWACFLSEQAAQLAVKALLHGTGLDAWGHDLTVLCARAGAELGSAWPGGLSDAAARLSRHYIATRYPDAVPSGPTGTHYNDSDAAQAEQDAGALIGAVDEAWRALGAA